MATKGAIALKAAQAAQQQADAVQQQAQDLSATSKRIDHLETQVATVSEGIAKLLAHFKLDDEPAAKPAKK